MSAEYSTYFRKYVRKQTQKMVLYQYAKPADHMAFRPFFQENGRVIHCLILGPVTHKGSQLQNLIPTLWLTWG